MVGDNPSDSLDVAASKRAERVRFRFRWRIVPTTVLAGFSAFVAFGLANVAVDVIGVWLRHPGELTMGVPLFLLGASWLITLCGSAAAWWKGRWGLAVIFTVIALSWPFFGPYLLRMR